MDIGKIFSLEDVYISGRKGVTPFNLLGRIPTPSTSHLTYWEESTLYAFRTAAIAMTLSSGSANDTLAGTGARTARVTYVDGNFNTVVDVLNLNGQTGVALSKNALGINNIELLTFGSGTKSAGIIYVGSGTVTTGKPAVVDNEVAAGLNQTTSLIYTVPAGFTLLMYNVTANTRYAAATAGYEFALRQIANTVPSNNAPSFGVEKLVQFTGYRDTAPYAPNYDWPIGFSQFSQVQATVLTGGNFGPAYMQAQCLLFENQYAKQYG